MNYIRQIGDGGDRYTGPPITFDLDGLDPRLDSRQRIIQELMLVNL